MIRTYDPSEVILIFGGIPISGFADGTFITVSRENDSFTKSVGASGETSRAKSVDQSGSVVVTLAQTSPSNDVLSGVAKTDELTSLGVLPILCKDNSGRSLFTGGNAWIRKPADAEHSKEISTREWTIDVADLEMFIGGNGSLL